MIFGLLFGDIKKEGVYPSMLDRLSIVKVLFWPVSPLADFHDDVSFKNYTNVFVVVMLKTTATKNM